MRKNHLLVLVSLLFVSIYICKSSLVYAEEVINNTNEEAIQIESRESALDAISKSKEEIKKEIAKIEEKLDRIKEKEEYKNYPAIRLNVDTPIFGLVSICNQKLKITSEVSTADIARGYSIKDIIKTNSLKVPSFSVGSIVVITRDVKFDETITLSDANTSILKLMQYLEQVQSVNKFLDKQIIKIYAEYIPKEKSEKINNLKNRLKEIENGQSELDKEMIKLYVSNLNNEKYSEYINSYIAINNNIYNYRQVLENVLINDDTLIEYEKKVVDLEAMYLNVKQNLKDTNINLSQRVELEALFSKIRNDFIQKKESIEKYISDSTIEKNIENVEPQDVNKDNNNENNYDIAAIEEIKVYDVTSNNILKEMEEKIAELDQKITETLGLTILNRIKGIETTETSEEIINKAEVTDIVTKELTVEDKDKLLEELYNIYRDYITKENKFYLDNINLLLKDTTSKISDLSKYTDYSSISDIKYIYLELPSMLKKEMEIYSLNNIIEINILNGSISEKLAKIVQINKNITTEYNLKMSQELQNSRENN